jgi:hypothetical protein
MHSMSDLFDNRCMTKQPTIERLSMQQLEGRRCRLERELTSAFSAQPLRGALIERLVEELTATARELDAMQRTPA